MGFNNNMYCVNRFTRHVRQLGYIKTTMLLSPSSPFTLELSPSSTIRTCLCVKCEADSLDFVVNLKLTLFVLSDNFFTTQIVVIPQIFPFKFCLISVPSPCKVWFVVTNKLQF